MMKFSREAAYYRRAMQQAGRDESFIKDKISEWQRECKEKEQLRAERQNAPRKRKKKKRKAPAPAPAPKHEPAMQTQPAQSPCAYEIYARPKPLQFTNAAFMRPVQGGRCSPR